VAQAVLAADLPLTPAPAPGAAAPLAQAPSNAFELGGFTIWGVDGDAVTASDFAYDEAAKTLTVNTDKHFAIQNADQTKGSDGYLAVNSSAAIVIPAGRDAHITLAGVGILSMAPLDLATGASCSLVLADGTKNSFKTNYPTTASATGNHSAIHCGTGSSISIDDSVSNRTSKGTPVIPEDGVVPRNPDLNPGDPAADEPYLLANGAKVRAGDPLTKLDSENPGALLAQNDANGMAAAIGAPYGEAGGSITIDGGIITAIGGRGDRGGSGYIDCAAGIGPQAATERASASGSPSTAAVSRPRAPTTDQASEEDPQEKRGTSASTAATLSRMAVFMAEASAPVATAVTAPSSRSYSRAARCCPPAAASTNPPISGPPAPR
jgi:hypothetical protein